MPAAAARRPDPAPMTAPRRYDLSGILVEDPHGIFSPALHRAMARNRYELQERLAVERMVRPGDRVLELGAGCGVIGVAAARRAGAEAVTSVEANPGLLPTIAHVHALNGVGGIRVLNAVAGAGAGTRPFHVSSDFWASSLDPDTPNAIRTEEVAQVDINALIAETRANVLVADIEGGEFALFDAIALDPIDLVIVELHPTPANLRQVGRFYRRMLKSGLFPDLLATQRPRVQVFRKPGRD